MSSSSSLTPDSGSELSELEDVETAELEKKLFKTNKPKGSLDAWLDGPSSPPPKRKREPSPAHDYILADNPDIAFIVMFRARFASAFPRFVSNFGPQDLENAIVGTPPGDLAEKLLCALLGLVLNRKKDVVVGAYNKALEEAISGNRFQWPPSWNKSPMSGQNSYHTMTPEQRLGFLKTLCVWALNTSTDIQEIIKESYKQNRHDDDLNQPLSVQPMGRDGDKRRYWLIEGQDDTYFRLYRESNPALKTSTWWSVAGNIEEIKTFSAKLLAENTQAAKSLSQRINAAIPRFEAGEEKRKRREYRLNRKAQFTKPIPGYSMYEGRTRGKRQKYTFSDDEDGTSDAYSGRRSTRNATPAEPAGPVVTQSGRQVRSRLGGHYGETLHSGQNGRATESPGLDTDGDAPNPRTRSGRASGGRVGKSAGLESDEESDGVSSENEWQGNENEDDDDADDETDGDVDMDDDDDELDAEDTGEKKSLVLKLKLTTRKALAANGDGTDHVAIAQDSSFKPPTDSLRMDTNGPVQAGDANLSPSKLAVGLSRPVHAAPTTSSSLSNGTGSSQFGEQTPGTTGANPAATTAMPNGTSTFGKPGNAEPLSTSGPPQGATAIVNGLDGESGHVTAPPDVDMKG